MLLCRTIHPSASASEWKGLSEKEARAYANKNNTWVICYQQGIRTRTFYQFDATDSYLYFSYSKNGCVDVYDTQGVFLYSIIFPERQNGAVCVRCENNLAYIFSKDHILYIFSGAEEVEHMDDSTASERGYDFFWFSDNEPNITVDSESICFLDETGSVIKRIPTPTIIRNTTPLPNDAVIAMQIIAAAIVLFVLVIKVLGLITAKYARGK